MSKPSLYPDTREHILDVGEQLIQQRGFTALGLSELLKIAGVPKGSFYHYFSSKEGFGVALLTRHFAHYDCRMQKLFTESPEANQRECLLRYFALWIERASCNDQMSSCLAVKLSGEVADLSEPMREALALGMNQVVAHLAAAIEAGVKQGSLAVVESPSRLAEALYASWLGMALRVKVLRDVTPMQQLLIDTEQRLRTP